MIQQNYKYNKKYFKNTRYYDNPGNKILANYLFKYKKKGKLLNVEKDLEKFSQNNKYDIILALDILEHLKNPERTISIINKFLKNEGVFIFRVPNLSCINLKILKLLGKKNEWIGYKDKTHISLLK